MIIIFVAVRQVFEGPVAFVVVGEAATVALLVVVLVGVIVVGEQAETVALLEPVDAIEADELAFVHEVVPVALATLDEKAESEEALLVVEVALAEVGPAVHTADYEQALPVFENAAEAC